MRRSIESVILLTPMICLALSSKAVSATEPKRVDVGVYVNGFDEINLKDGNVGIDFFIWFRWLDNDLKPFETFDLANGQIVSREGLTELELGDTKYACLRIRANVRKIWDVTRFPLDSHEIRLEIESNEAELHKQVYVPDTKDSGMSEKAQVAGWNLEAGEANVCVNRYATNYGDISLPTGAESLYSQFVYTMRMKRPSFSLFIKLFAGLYVAAGIAFISLMIRPIDLDPRFGLGVGAMFAAVASQYVLSSNLPDTPHLTMADLLHIVTFVYIFAVLLESTFSLQLWNRGKEIWSKRLDRWSLGILAISYCSLTIGIVYSLR